MHQYPVYPNHQSEAQWQYLDHLASQEVARVEISADELTLKDHFRAQLESLCRSLSPAIALHSFGSLSSGFATTGSDMDLAIVTDSSDSVDQLSMHQDSLPRRLEKELLDRGIGARLLTRTRVPIIKICEKPPAELLDALRKEREKWDALSTDEQLLVPGAPNEAAPSKLEPEAGPGAAVPDVTETASVDQEIKSHTESPHASLVPDEPRETVLPDNDQPDKASAAPETVKRIQIEEGASTLPQKTAVPPHTNGRNHGGRPWKRERANGPLDFPKEGVGIQCDINFFNPLGIHNTKLLRCYSKCDPRVRPMVLFIKAWAKRRKINSSYSGTLSSYGYVLMVLHYLVNVVQPPVLPNLQIEAARTGVPPTTVDGWEVRFIGDEAYIEKLASEGKMTHNQAPLGLLLRGFFQYFASTSGGSGFIWMQDVLSLRTPGGILKKEAKGWTGAKTEVGENVSCFQFLL